MRTIGFRAIVCSLVLCGLAGRSPAAIITITDLVGDVDGMGGAVSGSSVFGNFENRSAAELAATDGAQLTDYANQVFGTNFANPTFVHSFVLPVGGVIVGATWELAAGGIQSMNDRLYLDETLLSTTFPEQGANGFGLISWTIPSTFFGSLADGLAAFRVNLNSNNSGEPAFFDYARLKLDVEVRNNAVPEPATFALFSIGCLGMGIAAKRRRVAPTAQ